MYDLLTIGDIKLDTFIQIPEANVFCQLRLPECQLCIDYGKKNTVGAIELQIAGSAPNVAIALAKMNKKTTVLSQMGDDIIYQIALEYLKTHRVDSQFVKPLKKHSSSFAAVLNYKGESTQLVSHNGGEYTIPKTMPKTKWVHISELGTGYKTMYKKIIDCCKKNGKKISLNPGTIQINSKSKELFELLKNTDILFLNKVEAETLLDINEKVDIRTILSELSHLGPTYVVVTDGKNGAYAFNGLQFDYAPMFPGLRVEATGAGDAFASGFLGAIMNNEDHSTALKWGSVNAASVVGEVGPTKGLLTETEIKKRLKAKPKYKTKEL